jgi:hypothetical protein
MISAINAVPSAFMFPSIPLQPRLGPHLDAIESPTSHALTAVRITVWDIRGLEKILSAAARPQIGLAGWPLQAKN